MGINTENHVASKFETSFSVLGSQPLPMLCEDIKCTIHTDAFLDANGVTFLEINPAALSSADPQRPAELRCIENALPASSSH